MLRLLLGWFGFLRLQFWQAMMGPVIQAAANRSEFQFDRLTGQDNTFEQPWGKGPYWSTPTITELQAAQFDTVMNSAKKHKIHPLFALGSSANFSPSIGNAPQARQKAPQPGVDAPRFRKVTALEERVANASAQNDEAQAMYWRARAAKEAQGVMSGGAPDAGIDAGAGVKVYPLRDQGSRLQARPLKESPRESMPERIELVGEDGRRVMGLNPDAGLDEVGQAEYLRLKAVQAVTDLLMDRREKVLRKQARERAARRRHEARTSGIRRLFKR